MISLGLFLFLFLSKFLIMAFLAAVILTFVAFIVRKVGHISNYGRGDSHREQWLSGDRLKSLSQADRDIEPLFDHRENGAHWMQDFRSITVY